MCISTFAAAACIAAPWLLMHLLSEHQHVHLKLLPEMRSLHPVNVSKSPCISFCMQQLLSCDHCLQITDAANEAKDNVKYLATLEQSLEPMYMGTPHTIQDSLPTLINNIKMMHTIARYYNTSERMTILFQKVTNQMVRNCKEHILLPGKLWDQDKLVLLGNLTAAVHLNEAYQEQYRLKRDNLQASLLNRV